MTLNDLQGLMSLRQNDLNSIKSTNFEVSIITSFEVSERRSKLYREASLLKTFYLWRMKVSCKHDD